MRIEMKEDDKISELRIRDLFAMEAMKAIMIPFGDCSEQAVAKFAYEQADAMIKESNK